MKKALVLIAFLFLIVSCKPKYSVEFLTRNVTVGENTYGYRVYVPKDRPSGQKLPVMLYLHGSGSCGEDNEAQIAGFNKFIGAHPQNFSFIVVFPQARTGTFWNTQMIEQAIAALDQTVKEFDGDEKRLYVAGWSMGGMGAWHTAVLYPGKFTALIPIAGRVMPTPREREDMSPDLLSLVDAPKPFEAFGEKLKDMPTWIFHGEKDDAITVDVSRRMNRALIDTGNTDVHYTEYQGLGHYSIESALTEPKLFEWLAKQHIVAQTHGFTKMIELADGKFHELEFVPGGIFLDGVLKSKFDEPAGLNAFTFISETPEYWEENDHPAYWYLFGTSMAMGLCGIPTYRVARVDANGIVRVSENGPAPCVGDWPSSVEFEIRDREPLSKTEENLMPTWKISNALEFNGTTFTWKDLQKPTKRK